MFALKQIIIGVLAIGISVFGITSVLQAQDAPQQTGNGLKISPVRTERVLERGSTDSFEVSLENVTNLPINAEFFINDFLPADDGTATPQIVINESSDVASQYSIKPFVKAPKSIALAPGESKTVTLNMSIPNSTSPGSYFGILRAAPVNSTESSEGTQVGLTASVGSLVLVTVPGDVVELLNLKDAAVVKDGSAGTFFDSAPDAVRISLTNEGNVFTKPYGSVTVKNWGGEVVYQYELNDVQPRGNVLPGSYRTFENAIGGIGSFGKYTVQANIAYGDGGGNIVTVQKSFWVIPWKAIVLGAIALIVVALVSTRGIKAYNRMVVNRSKSKRVSKK